jgi:hypothetical protein
MVEYRKILNRPKEMNVVSTKVVLLFFPPVCPFAPSIFFQVTPIFTHGENMDGANGQTGGKNSSTTFVLTAFHFLWPI